MYGVVLLTTRDSTLRLIKIRRSVSTDIYSRYRNTLLITTYKVVLYTRRALHILQEGRDIHTNPSWKKETFDANIWKTVVIILERSWHDQLENACYIARQDSISSKSRAIRMRVVMHWSQGSYVGVKMGMIMVSVHG